MTLQNDEDHRSLDLETLRRSMAAKKGKEYWRSLNELAGSPEFDELVRQEFPRQADALYFLSRRDFLKILGASLALAGLTACMPVSPAQILPYTNPPQSIVPAEAIYYASSMVQDGYAKGVLIKTVMGRPIKVDGNPNHPDSQGASDVFMQASLLELYDPDRARQITQKGSVKTWQNFLAELEASQGILGQGAGLRILTGTLTSPSLINQLDVLMAKYPLAKWTQYNPVGRLNTLAGANLAFGQPYEPVYDFNQADVILSLDCDFLFSETGHLRYSRDFIARHQPISSNGTMNRLYVVESSATLTGSNADHRLALKPSQVVDFARAIADRLGVQAGTPPGNLPGQDWLDALSADLRRAGKSALVLAGERQPAQVHALSYAMNQALGSMGNTVRLIQPLEAAAGGAAAALSELVQDLNNGTVDTLVILDNNPAYAAPADLNFAGAMQKARQSIYLGYYPDETAALATWVIPAAHTMEMWGDARAFDGTVSLIQPVIQPLYGGKSPYEVLAALLGQANADEYTLLRTYWQGKLKNGNFDHTWREMLSQGVIPDSASQPAAALPNVVPGVFASAPSPSAGGLEIVFEPDPTVWDGRFTNNAWLQELPKPLTKLTWDNAAFMSPNTATSLGVNDGDLVALKLEGRTISAPVNIQPGQPDDVVVVHLGYGRKAGGTVLEGAGFNAYSIRTSAAPWFAQGLQVAKTGGIYELALTHEHFTMEGRDLVRSATLQEYQAHPDFAQDPGVTPPTLYGEMPPAPTGYAWGMTINLNTCIGCNACVVACQAENNIPSVGKDQVTRGREMHWLRIDRYFKGAADQPETYFEPVPCMQCEKAPCEPVCPVEATSHSAEGINEMTYNRCVGTRYCSNNCPYKVRRFNFYHYVDEKIIPLQAMRNPDVTVRSRGVMEKCTYCIQRITHSRIQAEVEGRQIRDGEVKTACQEACPTHAIIFGNINDPDSAVHKLKQNPLNYGLLAELGTRPRTTYLAKVKNPNPAIREPA
jgi:MoCo/4Fe-4S cofactor protein with predicted Tat translocation signal